MNSFLVNIALGLLINEAVSAAGSIDATATKQVINAKINAVITNTMVQATVDGLVDTLIDVAAVVLQQPAALKDLVAQAMAKNWPAAMLDLKNLLMKGLNSMTPTTATTELQAILAA